MKPVAPWCRRGGWRRTTVDGTGRISSSTPGNATGSTYSSHVTGMSSSLT